MSQQYYKSNSIAYKGYGCLLLLMLFGIIVAIERPSFLRQAGKAKQVEPKQYVRSMNRVQHAHFAEKGAFATSVNALEMGIKTETANCKYSVIATKKTAFNYGLSKKKDLKSCVGGVFVVHEKEVLPNVVKDEIITISILCQSDSPGTIEPAEPTYQNGKLICGQGTTEVTK
ncbi:MULTISPECIES: type IV pilin-like G/H family protein [unclassified Microcoleus]|uniref:type IV pilin-like G/H family protein n=1 Tax=unclassified Microcoleus TaxID=2642155 RepID=UPI002FD60989